MCCSDLLPMKHFHSFGPSLSSLDSFSDASGVPFSVSGSSSSVNAAGCAGLGFDNVNQIEIEIDNILDGIHAPLRSDFFKGALFWEGLNCFIKGHKAMYKMEEFRFSLKNMLGACDDTAPISRYFNCVCLESEANVFSYLIDYCLHDLLEVLQDPGFLRKGYINPGFITENNYHNLGSKIEDLRKRVLFWAFCIEFLWGK